jgi:hypothetical protein
MKKNNKFSVSIGVMSTKLNYRGYVFLSKKLHFISSSNCNLDSTIQSEAISQFNSDSMGLYSPKANDFPKRFDFNGSNSDGMAVSETPKEGPKIFLDQTESNSTPDVKLPTLARRFTGQDFINHMGRETLSDLIETYFMGLALYDRPSKRVFCERFCLSRNYDLKYGSIRNNSLFKELWSQKAIKREEKLLENLETLKETATIS